MDEEAYGIRKALPRLDEKTVEKLIEHLKTKVQVDQCGLEAVEEEDLTVDGLLGTRPAKILINYWREGKFFNCTYCLYKCGYMLFS